MRARHPRFTFPLSSVGLHTETSFPFTPVEAYDKSLTFKSGRCPARFYMEKLAPLVVSRKYDLGQIFSHRLPLADGVRGYEIFANRTDGCTKVVLTP